VGNHRLKREILSHAGAHAESSIDLFCGSSITRSHWHWPLPLLLLIATRKELKRFLSRRFFDAEKERKRQNAKKTKTKKKEEEGVSPRRKRSLKIARVIEYCMFSKSGVFTSRSQREEGTAKTSFHLGKLAIMSFRCGCKFRRGRRTCGDDCYWKEQG